MFVSKEKLKQIWYEPGFEDGVKQNMQDLFSMLDLVSECCPAPSHDGNYQFMFEYFKKEEYRNLQAHKGDDLFKKVFFILSRPIFLDLEDISRFIYKCHEVQYIRNEDIVAMDIRLDGERSSRGWAECICENIGQSLHNVLSALSALQKT